MTTETTCLSSIWRTDDTIKEFYEIHKRPEELQRIESWSSYILRWSRRSRFKFGLKPMIAMPFHPSNTYTIEEVNANLDDILADVEKRALVSLDGAVDYTLRDKIRNGRLYVEQGIIAGCCRRRI